jgi:hypothetical protein
MQYLQALGLPTPSRHHPSTLADILSLLVLSNPLPI